MNLLLIPRVLIVLVASLHAALSLTVTLQTSEYAQSEALPMWVLAAGVPLTLAVLSGVFIRRWAAFVYAGWSLFSALWAVGLFLVVADSYPSPAQWVFDLATWTIWLALIGVVVGLVVGVLLPRSGHRSPPPDYDER